MKPEKMTELAKELIEGRVDREEVKKRVPIAQREEFVLILVSERQRVADAKAAEEAMQKADEMFLKELDKGVSVTPPESIDEAVAIALKKAADFPSLIATKAGVIDLAAFVIGINIWDRDVKGKKRIAELAAKLFEALNIPYKRSTIASHLNDNPIMGKSVRGIEMFRAFPHMSE